MNKKEDRYPIRKSKESLPSFFLDVSLEVVRDSWSVYKVIFAVSITVSICSFLGSHFWSFHLLDFHRSLLFQLNGIYLLIPPFILAIIAMFPAFSEKTKKVLSEKDENDKAFGAVFLNEFAFLTFWSLVFLAHTVLTRGAYSLADEMNWSVLLSFLGSINIAFSLIIILAIAFEIFYSLKIMYLLVLREYY